MLARIECRSQRLLGVPGGDVPVPRPALELAELEQDRRHHPFLRTGELLLERRGEDGWKSAQEVAGRRHSRRADHAFPSHQLGVEYAPGEGGVEILQAGSGGRPWAVAAGARSAALVAAASGDLAAATEAIERALAEHERLPQPFEFARTLLVLGGVQRRQRQKRLARETLGRALETFQRLGTPLWAEKTRDELRRIGGRPAAPAELTPVEERVARLAAGGCTNREIADALFMSVKTVERHLSHAFGKLGVSSRRELRSRLAAA